jgi:hypothetical protein
MQDNGHVRRRILLKERRFGNANDPESYAGRSVGCLVGPPMPDRSKGRGQRKWSPWYSRLGVERGAKTPRGKIYCYETMGKLKNRKNYTSMK